MDFSLRRLPKILREPSFLEAGNRLHEVNAMDHAQKARDLFLEGYNCSQAVVCAFDDLTGLDRETSARRASSFG